MTIAVGKTTVSFSCMKNNCESMSCGENTDLYAHKSVGKTTEAIQDELYNNKTVFITAYHYFVLLLLHYYHLISIYTDLSSECLAICNIFCMYIQYVSFRAHSLSSYLFIFILLCDCKIFQ